jgi:hypothetical protein
MRRKSPAGTPTNDLVFSAYQGANHAVFPLVLQLYVAPGSRVADVTYGHGVFWKQIPQGTYELLASDLKAGVDCRSLPYPAASLDALVFDPPYMHTPGGTAHVNHQNYENYYANNAAGNGLTTRYHEAVLELYVQTGLEALRVLRPGGIFIVKCQDEVCANQQRLTHVEVINDYARRGLLVEDLFVLMRTNRPGVSRLIRQVHARKNHSYFLVFRKPGGGKPRRPRGSVGPGRRGHAHAPPHVGHEQRRPGELPQSAESDGQPQERRRPERGADLGGRAQGRGHRDDPVDGLGEGGPVVDLVPARPGEHPGGHSHDDHQEKAHEQQVNVGGDQEP